MSLVPLLSAVSVVAAMVAIIVYFLVLMRRPAWVRLLNGSGLFLTGVALFQAPAMLGQSSFGQPPRLPSVNMIAAVLMLIGAVVAQGAAALRNRRAWDGVDRRRPGELEARS